MGCEDLSETAIDLAVFEELIFTFGCHGPVEDCIEGDPNQTNFGLVVVPDLQHSGIPNAW
jgi:hypothetical protein